MRRKLDIRNVLIEVTLEYLSELGSNRSNTIRDTTIAETIHSYWIRAKIIAKPSSYSTRQSLLSFSTLESGESVR